MNEKDSESIDNDPNNILKEHGELPEDYLDDVKWNNLDKDPDGSNDNQVRKKKKLFRIFYRDESETLPEAGDGVEAFDIEEIKALVRYSIDKGIAVNKEIIRDILYYLEALKGDLEYKLELQIKASLALRYQELTAITYPSIGVSGRTIIDSAKYSNGALTQAAVWGVLFIMLAIMPDLFLERVNYESVSFSLIEMLIKLSPFFWGGVGASIFLLKSLSEYAGKSKFDSRRLQGIPTRIFLGAALGYIVVVVLELTKILEASGTEGFQFTTGAIGFLTGLGVKAVYGILEMFIEGISSRVRGENNDKS